eukprot:TRINITY_DN1427_c0_g1_i1.p1 TRINITY_DN1427_c0_g1~~TRINITY_DN1427_c0_g1_i1.p1  ORF type:complete len:160 (-),score=52.45 TRINITY_DN1427_c0_g1_i1:64-543(-)
MLRYANKKTFIWKQTPDWNLDYALCLPRNISRFYLWEYLGHGADGKTFLVSGGTKGAVGVLKFFLQDAEENATKELKMWQSVYGDLKPVASARVVTVTKQEALLMPWFRSPQRNAQELAAIEETLRNDYVAVSYTHLRAHETVLDLVCRLLLEKKKKKT